MLVHIFFFFLFKNTWQELLVLKVDGKNKNLDILYALSQK